MKPKHRETYRPIKVKGGHSQIIGYARVSTREQGLSIASQVDTLKQAGASVIYTETASGASAQPILRQCVESLRKGDTLTVVRLDRLGRKLGRLVVLLDELDEQGVYVRALAQGLNTRTKAHRDQANIIAALAEYERNLIRERTREGLAEAAKRGRIGGRPVMLTASVLELVRHLKSEGHSNREIGKAVRLSEKSVRNALARLETSDPRQLPLL